MDNTTVNSANDQPTPERARIAGIPARVLAMLIDYLVVAAATLLVGKLSAYSDAAYLITFFVMALYFSSGNSSVLEGQTLGKRTFGLRVVSCKDDRLYPNFSEGFWRFFLAYGAIILGAETPTMIYRSSALVASPKLLELHMLFVMFLLFANCVSVIFRSDRRALHDVFCSTIVVRGSGEFAYDAKPRPISRSVLLPATVGAVFALLLWLPSVTHNPQVTAVQRSRYLLENRTPLRLVGASTAGDKLLIHLVYAGLAVTSDGGDDASVPADIEQAVTQAVDLIQEANPEQLADIKSVSTEVDAMDITYNPRRYVVETALAGK
ncbi:MAG: RDD family protein [Bdellovibrionales bacterium]|nr:RDD family protein [Bdellovibrionales bacterium]